MLLSLHLVIVALQVFATSKFLQHYHLIFPLIWGLLKKTRLLLLLGEIDNISPALLVLCFKLLKELIEPLIAFGH